MENCIENLFQRKVKSTHPVLKESQKENIVLNSWQSVPLYVPLKFRRLNIRTVKSQSSGICFSEELISASIISDTVVYPNFLTLQGQKLNHMTSQYVSEFHFLTENSYSTMRQSKHFERQVERLAYKLYYLPQLSTMNVSKICLNGHYFRVILTHIISHPISVSVSGSGHTSGLMANFRSTSG